MIFSKIHNKIPLELVLVFFIILLMKIYLSLRFPTPFVFGDEYLYASYAKNILSNPFCLITPAKYQIYPPGYPLLLTPAFIFYPNMELVYRFILVINALFSTSVIFISYFILKKFVAQNFSIFGSILVALLPVNTLYSFIIFSENLYIVLYLLSGFLILKSFEQHKNNTVLHIFTGSILFYLILTRTFGIIAFISFFSVMIYRMFIEKNQINVFLKKNCFLIGTPIILLATWIILKNVYGLSLSGYNSSNYTDNLLYTFNTYQNFIQFSKLFIHEIDYLILTSYFIFFILFILILLYWKGLELPLKTYILYSFIYGFLSIILTVLHMMTAATNPDHPQHLYYFIWGRYIDPVVSTIFIIGLISWDKFILNHNRILNNNEILKKIFYITIFTILFFVSTYPHFSMHKVVNVMSIVYTKVIITQSLFLFYLLPLILSLIFFIFSKKAKTLIMVLIIFSLLISIPSFEWIKIVSNNVETTNGNQRLLNHDCLRNYSILIDQESFSNPYLRDISLIKFWLMPNKLIYESNLTDINTDVRYIISKKPLRYEIATVSPNRVILYKSNITPKIQVIPLTGFHQLIYKNNSIYGTWMENNATLSIWLPNSLGFSDQYLMILKSKSFYHQRRLDVYVNDKLIHEQMIQNCFVEIQIPIKLKAGENIIKLYTPDGCQIPSSIPELKSSDTRCLSILFSNITIVNKT